MRGVDVGRLHTRVKGRAAITQSVRRLLIRTHRFATVRAVTVADQLWASRVIAALQVVLDDSDNEVKR